MRTIKTCKNCSTQLPTEQQCCEVCGALIEPCEENDFTVECETHSDHCATGLCVICGRPVCSECLVKSAEKILCNDHEHSILLQEWNVMYQSDSEFETDALVRNLANGGMETKTFSLHDHVATYWLNENRVRLFVKKSEEEKAKALLKELNLIGNY
jgi:hypothetical protein